MELNIEGVAKSGGTMGIVTAIRRIYGELTGSSRLMRNLDAAFEPENSRWIDIFGARGIDSLKES